MFGDDGCASGRVLAVAGMDVRNVQRRGFPIKGVDGDDQGKEETRWEAVKMEKKPLDDKQFFPPADYWKHDMP